MPAHRLRHMHLNYTRRDPRFVLGQRHPSSRRPVVASKVNTDSLTLTPSCPADIIIIKLINKTKLLQQFYLGIHTGTPTVTMHESRKIQLSLVYT